MKPLLTTLVLILAPSSIFAEKIKVAPDGPFPTVQAGVNAAAPGDTIEVAPGVYFGSVFVSSSLTGLRIEGGGKVLLDGRLPGGSGAGPVVRLDAADVRLRGFRIRNAAKNPISNARRSSEIMKAGATT